MKLGKEAMEALRAEVTGRLLLGDELVVAGPVGLKGTSLLVSEKEEEMSAYFSKGFLEDGKDLYNVYRTDKEGKDMTAWEIGEKLGAHCLYKIGDGGFLAALWKVAEASQTGLTADLRKVPVRQETIEISEIFSINPYRLYGSGAVLMGTPRGEELVSQCKRMGYMAAVIGTADKGNDRLLYSGENARYLERPAKDELKGVLETWQD